jgi:hypothetical protein
VAVGITAAGCAGENEAEAVTTDDVKPLDAPFVPETMLGLAVDPEDTEGLDDVTGSYLEAVRLFSVRDGDQLVATFQVGRFADGVEWATRSFQRSVLNQVGATAPNPVRLGDDVVFVTSGVKQRLAVWFREGHLFVLGTRDEFDRPRTLLREALEVSP